MRISAISNFGFSAKNIDVNKNSNIAKTSLVQNASDKFGSTHNGVLILDSKGDIVGRYRENDHGFKRRYMFGKWEVDKSKAWGKF